MAFSHRDLFYCQFSCLRPNEKISVFWVTGLKILGRVGTQNFFFF